MSEARAKVFARLKTNNAVILQIKPVGKALKDPSWEQFLGSAKEGYDTRTLGLLPDHLVTIV